MGIPGGAGKPGNGLNCRPFNFCATKSSLNLTTFRSIGVEGPAGPQGNTGLPGEKGDKGSLGPLGPRGKFYTVEAFKSTFK